MTGGPPVEDRLPALARSCWRELETLHVVGYFAPEPTQAYRDLGIKGRHGYFAARSAAMGPVPALVVEATFYVFAPRVVAAAVPSAWDIAPPAQVLEARHAGVLAALRGALGDPSGIEGLDEALALAQEACAGLSAPGRALYAGHASLPWPQDPLLALWHAATLLREHRGDGHVAALLQAGLDPIEAMLTYASPNGPATPMMPFLRLTRGWTDEEWDAAAGRLRARGLADEDGSLTDDAVALRASVERTTDEAAMPGWQHLGVDGAERLKALMRPIRERLVGSGVFPAGMFGSR